MMRWKKDKRVVRTIKCGLYKCSLTFMLGHAPEEYISLANRRYNVDIPLEEAEKVGGQFSWEDTHKYIIWVRDPANMGYAIHEIIHFVLTLFGERNISVGAQACDHEHFAYYVEWWTRKYMDILENNNVPRGTKG